MNERDIIRAELGYDGDYQVRLAGEIEDSEFRNGKIRSRSGGYPCGFAMVDKLAGTKRWSLLPNAQFKETLHESTTPSETWFVTRFPIPCYWVGSSQANDLFAHHATLTYLKASEARRWFIRNGEARPDSLLGSDESWRIRELAERVEDLARELKVSEMAKPRRKSSESQTSHQLDETPRNSEKSYPSVPRIILAQIETLRSDRNWSKRFRETPKAINSLSAKQAFELATVLQAIAEDFDSPSTEEATNKVISPATVPTLIWSESSDVLKYGDSKLGVVDEAKLGLVKWAILYVLKSQLGQVLSIREFAEQVDMVKAKANAISNEQQRQEYVENANVIKRSRVSRTVYSELSDTEVRKRFTTILRKETNDAAKKWRAHWIHFKRDIVILEYREARTP